jgi:hypothetical protein
MPLLTLHAERLNKVMMSQIGTKYEVHGHDLPVWESDKLAVPRPKNVQRSAFRTETDASSGQDRVSCASWSSWSACQTATSHVISAGT